jgi:hypothetical protein
LVVAPQDGLVSQAARHLFDRFLIVMRAAQTSA